MVAILVLITILTCLTIDYFAERAALRQAVKADRRGLRSGQGDRIPAGPPSPAAR